jgi:hypothetical protein
MARVLAQAGTMDIVSGCFYIILPLAAQYHPAPCCSISSCPLLLNTILPLAAQYHPAPCCSIPSCPLLLNTILPLAAQYHPAPCCSIPPLLLSTILLIYHLSPNTILLNVITLLAHRIQFSTIVELASLQSALPVGLILDGRSLVPMLTPPTPPAAAAAAAAAAGGGAAGGGGGGNSEGLGTSSNAERPFFYWRGDQVFAHWLITATLYMYTD